MSKHQSSQAGFAHLTLIVVVVLALVAGAGVYIYGLQNNNDQDALSNANEVQKISLSKPLPADLLSLDKVRELAAADKPNLAIQQIELESEHGQLLYKVRLADGSFVLYNARSGVKVTKQAGQPAEVEKDTSLPADFQAGISFDKAREIALAQKPGGQIRKIELEMEHGVAVFSVRFTDDARIDVNAANGEIVRTKPAKTDASGQPASGGSNSGSGSSGSGSDDDRSVSDDSSDDSSGSSSGSSGSGSGRSGGSDDN